MLSALLVAIVRRIMRAHQHHRALRTLLQCQIQESVERGLSVAAMQLWRGKVWVSKWTLTPKLGPWLVREALGQSVRLLVCA